MMKKLYLILTCAALCACGNSNAKKQTSDMATTKDIVKESDSIIENNAKTPTIDTNKKYPFKEFILNDLADITYISIETNNDVLYKLKPKDTEKVYQIIKILFIDK